MDITNNFEILITFKVDL